MSDVIRLPDIRVARYRFTLDLLETVHLPRHKGSALRGGFGHTLKRLTCYHRGGDCAQCSLGNDCVYGYLFETSPPGDSEVLRNLSEVARPFVIEPPLEQRETYEPGERLDFYVVLIGRGIGYLPYFVLAFQQLGNAGLGRSRGRFELQEVVALGPNESEEPIFSLLDQMIRDCDVDLGAAEWQDRAAALMADSINVAFLAPTRLKHSRRFVREGPRFQVLIRALLGRVSSLSYFHCGDRWETDFRGWIDRASEVHLASADTHWVDWARYSGRQRQRVRMGGLVGSATYEGNIEPFLPLLAVGENVHVGKGTVFGNGWLALRNASGVREGDCNRPSERST